MNSRILFAILVTASQIVSQTARAFHQLAMDGRNVYVITIPDDAIPAEKTAAQELQTHLKQMTDADFTIVTASEYNGGPRLAVGFQKGLPEVLSSEHFLNLGPEELVIDSSGDTILLAGGRPRGALYATYEFLESLGVRWFTPIETFIPHKPTLYVEITPTRYTSPFRSRTNVPGNGATAEWCARNRMNSLLEWSHPGEKYGDGIKQGPDMHTLWRLMSPEIFKTHPEWAAMVDGKRITNHANNHWGACLSNPELQNFIVARTMDWLRKHPDMTDVWFGQNDGSPYCTCPDCQAFYDKHGGVPSSIICFVINKLADAVAAEFPHVRVKSLAYAWSRTPPKNMTLRDNVTIMLCATFGWFSELGEDASTTTFINDMKEWKKVCGDFEAYLYSHPTDDFWFPASCLYNQARNIQRIKDLGIKSIHQEIYSSNFGGEFVHLRAWLYTRMMWRPDSDIETLIKDFCQGYYGNAAEDVLYAIHRTEKHHADGWRPQGKMAEFVPDYLEPDVIEDVLPRLQTAYDAQQDPVLKRRLGLVLLPYLWADYWINFHGAGKIDNTTNLWGVSFTNRKRCALNGNLIRKLMIENKITALRLGGGGFNVHTFRLAEMTKAYSYEKLADDKYEIIVVPGLMGKMVKFAHDGKDVLKAIWGHQMYQYPMAGYGRDTFLGHEPAMFSPTSVSSDSVKLSANTPNGLAEKTFALKNGTLTYKLHFQARQKAKGRLSTAPRFNMNADCFGIYPKLYISNGNGWRLVELGKAGTMWYQAASLPINGFSGKMVLIAEDRHLGLEIQIPPEQLGNAGYMYDRYDFQPKGSGRMLELTFSTSEHEFVPNDISSLDITYRLLSKDEISVIE
ncbi:MAG: DUF4838 domain-containing protein [Victivallales bacterium]|nr:DUF4838 domain-containing protein [Victivallales bacterium]